MISNSLRSLFKFIGVVGCAVGCIAATQSALSSPLAQFESAAVTARIAVELNQQNISTELKAALIENARPEDAVALRSLLARYKNVGDVKFKSVLGRLIATRNGGDVVFSIETDEAAPGRFAINGREWKTPPTGSILNSLNRDVFRGKKGRSAKVELFFPEAYGEESSSPAAKMAAFVFVSATRNRNGMAFHDDAANYLSKKEVFDVLLRGSGFPQATAGDKVKSFWDAIWISPINVQCTPEGAKGFALVAGSEVEFVVQDDLSVILKSRGNEQALKFVAHSSPLESRAAEFKRALAEVKPLAPDKDATKNESQAAKLGIGTLNKLCDLRGMPPASAQTTELCKKVRELEQQLKFSNLKLLVYQDDLGASKNIKNRPRLMDNGYVNETAKWLEANRTAVDERIKEIAGTLVIKDHTGTISACANRDCSKTIPSNPDSVYGYRIPPNNTEESVKKAIAFKPRSSPKSKAEIQYSCPTKNQACERVDLVNGEDLSGEDLVIAQSLVEAANKDLNWQEGHTSVSQPVSILRALAPCCKDTKCRAAVVESGANLIPSNGTKSDGVAK